MWKTWILECQRKLPDMPNYDFLNLSPTEFEELSRDLLQKHLGVYLESFTQGRDDGIDLRYSRDKENTLIVQCKRYKEYSDLKSNLKKEAKKVAKLKFARYILTTSVGLTPANKDDIVAIFGGLIQDTADIIGKDEMNGLLGKHPDIEKQHYKLWLSSTAVIERILHSDVTGRSDFELEEIQRTICLYVQNKSNSEAVRLLNEYNYAIISGIPGIGKTTLAKMLCYQYVSEGYELIVISGDINEAEKLLKRDAKQVFYYDDFLGTNFLEVGLVKNEEKRLIRFIEVINRSRTKKLILTTREYILNQARIKYEILTSTKLDVSKCIIDLSKYTKRVKAQILYNHLFFFDVPMAYIDSLLNKKRYFHIINHPNYNPRAIEFMTQNIVAVAPEDYFDYFIGNLNNPSRIWEHSFEHQITGISKYVLYSLLLFGGSTTLEALEESFISLVEVDKAKYSLDLTPHSFKTALRELEDTFIRTNTDKQEEVIVSFQNPSVQDFLVNYIQENLKHVSTFIKGVPYFNQLIKTYNPVDELMENKINLTDDLVGLLTETIINKFEMKSFELNYSMSRGNSTTIYLKYSLDDIDKLFEISEMYDLDKNKFLKIFVAGKFRHAVMDSSNIYNTGGYLKLIEKCKDDLSEHLEKVIERYIDSMSDMSDIDLLEQLKDMLPDQVETTIVKMGKDTLISHIEDIIESEIESYEEFDEGLKDDLESKIRSINDRYDINEDKFEDLLEEKLRECGVYGDPDPIEDYGGSRGSGESDDSYIENMFNSLKG
jgi:hypothetical protein